jgi:hypothetical protein
VFHDIRAARAAAVVAGLTLAFLATPAQATCYSSPFPSCPVGTDQFKSPLFTLAAGETPMAFVDPRDRSPRRLVPLKIGRIRTWSGSALLPADFLDIDAKVTSGGERGLLAMAVHPQYLANGYFFLKYTSQGPPAPGDFGDIVIERYSRSPLDPNLADPASARTVLVIDHSEAGNHNGGWLAFGPDGFLYVSTGDGGNGCDTPIRDGQNPDSLRGKLLRIDIDGDDFPADPDRNYAIPPGNPYVGGPGADEVWAIGLRNPFRFSFDRSNGDLFIGDVGQDNWEEIDHQAAATPAPVNFGWVCREGCDTSATGNSACSLGGGECSGHTGTTCEYPTSSGLWDPILCFSNPDGWISIMGGYRYRGDFVPDHAGRYLFADASDGEIWRSDASNLTIASCWDGGNSGIYAFGEDHLGELYVVNGVSRTVECLHDGNPDGCYWAYWGGFFQDDFETGDVSRWSSSIP